jgi:hypothetical protein
LPDSRVPGGPLTWPYSHYCRKDNFQVDRDAADQLDRAAGRGTTSIVAWENRRFLQRAVAYLAEAGIGQFLDIGAGLPTQGNVHEIAQQTNPATRVAYVDNDQSIPGCVHEAGHCQSSIARVRSALRDAAKS